MEYVRYTESYVRFVSKPTNPSHLDDNQFLESPEPEKDDTEKDEDFTSWSIKQHNRESNRGTTRTRRGGKGSRGGRGGRGGSSNNNTRSSRSSLRNKEYEGKSDYVNKDLFNSGAVPYGYGGEF